MNGATGIIYPGAHPPELSERMLIGSALSLFAGSATFEDTAVLPASDPATSQLLEDLRRAGRIPLLGRAGGGKGGESLLALLDENTSTDTLQSLERDAAAGSTIYLEGCPALGTAAERTAMEDLTGMKIQVLDHPARGTLILNDPWLFGVARGTELPVRQVVNIAPRDERPGKVKKESGIDALIAPRFPATLSDGSGGVSLYGVGKGRVLWLPQSWAQDAPPEERVAYYSAIAGISQAALVEQQVQEGQAAPLVTLRLTRGKSLILALFNPEPRAVTTALSVHWGAQYVEDLATGATVPSAVRGLHCLFSAPVQPGEARFFVLADSSKALEKERQSNWLRVRLY
jgi:hypothetical protein